MTRLGLPGTEDRTSPAPDVWTGTPGKARPSSSAVRRAPTTLDRTVRPPQLPHSKSLATAPHQRQVGIASPAFNDNLSLIHISEPTRLGMISYAVFCLKKKNK